MTIQPAGGEKLAEIIRVQAEIAGAGLGLAQVMDVVTTRAQRLMGATGAVLELAEGDEMVYRAVSGTADGNLGLRLRRHGSLSGLCVETGEALVCVDSESDSRVDRAACRRVSLRSMIVVPLQHGGSTLGVLKVMSSAQGAFSADDAGVLQLLSALISASMGNARVYEATSSRAAEFAHMATHDPLTGLANRALAFDRLRYLVAHCKRAGGSAGVILLDIDGFKQINDRLGHDIGDRALCWIADRLSEAVRDEDLPARLGGDEFVVVLGTPTDAAGLALAGGRIAAAVTGGISAGVEGVPIRPSVGTALSSDDLLDPTALLKVADMEMYRQKRLRQGR